MCPHCSRTDNRVLDTRLSPDAFLSSVEREEPMAHAVRAKIHAMLPLHVRSCGPIVDVQEIFEVSVVP